MLPATHPVVYVTHHLPWPAHNGGRVRDAQLLRRLAGRFDIEVVAVSKVPELDRGHVEEAARVGVRAHVFGTQSTTGGRSGPLNRRHASPAARRYLAGRLRESGSIVHVEGHYLLELLPEHAQRAALLVEHNVESHLYEQRAALSRDTVEHATLRREATRTRRDELHAWSSVRTIATVTDEDANAIRTVTQRNDVLCLPNGADHLDASSVKLDPSRAPRMLFVGALGYEPNRQAVRLLIDDILPKVLRHCPDAALAVVGSDPPPWLIEATRKQPLLTVTGPVPDVAPWLDAADVVVCPLTVGGGVKVKVLEALARGCAIVATPIALQGLRYLPAGAVVERVGSCGFAEACVGLLASSRKRDRQRARAAAAARRLPSWDTAADMLADTWTALSESPSSRSASAVRA